MQEAALEILFFADGQEKEKRRLDLANAAIVANGGYNLNAKKAWPEFYGDPSDFVPQADSDLSGFQWEPPTPESYAKDLQAIMAGSERISLREEPVPEPPVPQQPVTAPEFEWT